MLWAWESICYTPSESLYHVELNISDMFQIFESVLLKGPGFLATPETFTFWGCFFPGRSIFTVWSLYLYIVVSQCCFLRNNVLSQTCCICCTEMGLKYLQKCSILVHIKVISYNIMNYILRILFLYGIETEF